MKTFFKFAFISKIAVLQASDSSNPDPFIKEDHLFQTANRNPLIREVPVRQTSVSSNPDRNVEESGIPKSIVPEISVVGFDDNGYYTVKINTPQIGCIVGKLQYHTLRDWAEKQIKNKKDVNWNAFPRQTLFGKHWQSTVLDRQEQFHQWFHGLSDEMKTEYFKDLPLIDINIEDTQSGEIFQIHVSGDNQPRDIEDAIRSYLELPADATVVVTFAGQELTCTLDEMHIEGGSTLRAAITIPPVTSRNGNHNLGTYRYADEDTPQGQWRYCPTDFAYDLPRDQMIRTYSHSQTTWEYSSYNTCTRDEEVVTTYYYSVERDPTDPSTFHLRYGPRKGYSYHFCFMKFSHF